MNTALILIDIQNDYFPGGKMELEGSVAASLRAKDVLSLFRESSMPVVHIQHISARPGATFFIPDTEGAKIHENVQPLPSESTIRKNYPNSFRETSLLEHLRKEAVEHVVIAGMMTHMCVDATTRAAFDYGFQCSVVHDGCAARALSFKDKIVPAEHVHMAFLAALNGIYARVVSAEELKSILMPVRKS
jgi:nicotinamidase-related amidase